VIDLTDPGFGLGDQQINFPALDQGAGLDDPLTPARNIFRELQQVLDPPATAPTTGGSRMSTTAMVPYGGSFTKRIFRWLLPYLVRQQVLGSDKNSWWNLAYQWWVSHGTPRPRPRRMNPLNPHALRRATRRLAGFQKFQRRTEKVLRRLAPPQHRRPAGRQWCNSCGKSPCSCR
jgi:hypothetical protein